MKRDMQATAKVLAILQDRRRHSVRAIAESLGKRFPTIYQLLARLEERGEVQRTPGDHSGRNPQLWFIPQGLSLREQRRASLAENFANAKIEKGVPMPTLIRRAGIAVLVEKMEVGDSVVLPAAKTATVASAARRRKMKFSRRTLADGTCRFWRVK